MSAFVAENQVVLGEMAVAEKTNEITAKKADYVIGLKGNQSSFHEDVALYFRDFKFELENKSIREKGHGRIEKREYRLLTDVEWITNHKELTNLNAVGMVQSTVTENDKTRTDIRYFITSLTNLSEFAYAVRKHWSIEN